MEFQWDCHKAAPLTFLLLYALNRIVGRLAGPTLIRVDLGGVELSEFVTLELEGLTDLKQLKDDQLFSLNCT